MVYGHPVTLVTDPGLEMSMTRLLTAYGAQVNLVSEPHPTGGWQQARRDRVGRLMEQHPGLKALYISAHSAPYLMDHGLVTKNDVILQKPFEMQDLAFRLTELYSPDLGLTQLARGGFERRQAQCGRA